MIDKKYYDILNMVTKENIFSKCFEFLEKNNIECDNLEIEIGLKKDYTPKEIEKFNIPIIGNNYIIANNTNYKYSLNYYNNSDYFKNTNSKKIKRINKMIKHFIKNNNFSNEFFENPICW